MSLKPSIEPKIERLLDTDGALYIVLDGNRKLLLQGKGVPEFNKTPDFSSIENLVPFELIFPDGRDQAYTPVLQQEGDTKYWLLIPTESCLHSDRQKEAFLSYAVHELKNPVSAVFSWSELLSNDMLTKSAEKAEAYQILFQESQRISIYLSKILQLFRIQSGRSMPQLQETSVTEIVEKTIHHLQDLANKRQVSLFVEDDCSSSLLVLADPVLLLSALCEITENALYASAPGKEITIRISAMNDQILIEIHDEGKGIPEDIIAKLPQAFHIPKLDSSQKFGIGVGIPITAKIVEMHNGSLSIQAGSPEGLVVRISLPRLAN